MRQRVAVYCIAEIESARPLKFDLFKIGVTSNLRARAGGLQIGNPRRVHPIAVDWYKSREAALAAETAIHEYMKDHAVRGEWFSFKDGNGACPFESMCCAPRLSQYRLGTDLYYDWDVEINDMVLCEAPR